MSKAKVKKASKGTSGHGAGKRCGEMFSFDLWKEYVIIGLDTDDGPEHRLYDERNNRPVDQRILKPIRKYGVLKPVHFERDGDRILINDGRQRLRCARIVWKEQEAEGVPRDERIQVRGIPFRGDEAELSGVSAAANVHVEDGDPMISAKKAQRHMRYLHSEEDVAVAMGVTTQTVKQWLASLGLAPEIKAVIRGGKMSATAGTKLAKLTKAEQAKIAKEIANGGTRPTVEEAANKVRVARGKAPLVTAKGKLSLIGSLVDRLPTDQDDADPTQLWDAIVGIREVISGGSASVAEVNADSTGDRSHVRSSHVGDSLHDSSAG